MWKKTPTHDHLRQVRSQLVDALRLDFVGSRPSEPGHARYRDKIPVGYPPAIFRRRW